MSSFVRTVSFEAEVEGKRVTAKMKALRYADAIRLEGIEVIPASDSEEDKKKARASEDRQVAVALGDVLPTHVIEFDGPLDADGAPVSIQEVCENAYFSALVIAMGKRLLVESSPKIQRKLPAPSVSSSKGKRGRRFQKSGG